ncbi:MULTISPECIES: hypothetical protein [unclassified Mesorhizobium]|uniref:hypothetical protein n=1 Tax=unclassified Mesorhizobium TaxID=325217 RepID=UPI000FE479F9|nr:MULTISPECIES: hypothetical protein [unclassified Mesorhizobium]RWB98679.1 MAG: hypothetical protein EOQ57_20920 [Mesorhizobium sp.]TGV21934.1 hypothetical protein EN786_32010 [Mesorhizobium sp. M4B.F.Ca.ET.143.01.1.1]TIU20007.1 MAG: hypothetical protein E5W49_13675 [Mesorhizobium sp.]
MSEKQSFTFYTYSRCAEFENDRWAYTGIPDFFFEDAESARQAVLELRAEIAADPDEEWFPMQLEKIETLPISKETIFALLNKGVGAFLKSYEITEVVN